jgi:hypothetical protein
MNLAKSERFWALLLEVQHKRRQLFRTSNGSNYTIRGVPVSRRKKERQAGCGSCPVAYSAVNCLEPGNVQSVPLATEPGISLTILTPMKILQRNLNRNMFFFLHISYTMKYVSFKFRCNILISGKIIKEMPGSVASGTLCITTHPRKQ